MFLQLYLVGIFLNGNNSRPSSKSSSQSIARQSQCKLVFGSNIDRPKETK